MKTNFGHSQSASGALGLMKAVLALQHGVVPQNLHFTRLPDELAEIETKLFVPQEHHAVARPNGSTTARGGVVVRAVGNQRARHPRTSARSTAAPVTSRRQRPTARRPLLFPLSATSADELRVTAGRLADWVADAGDRRRRCSDLAYTLARRRAHRPVRTAVVASSLRRAGRGLREVADGDTPYQAAVGQDDRGPVWVFSGQGSQWAGMGADLLATEPVFAATVAAMEPLIADESGFSVTEAMSAPQTVTGIDRVQPTMFAMQVALAATMKSLRGTPGRGHRAFAGRGGGGRRRGRAVAGGRRARHLPPLAADVPHRRFRRDGVGGTACTAGAFGTRRSAASTDVVLSVVASPQSTVIGGATQTVRELVAAWEQRDVMAREVAVDVASHSPQVDPILDELADALADLEPDDAEDPVLLGDPVRPA